MGASAKIPEEPDGKRGRDRARLYWAYWAALELAFLVTLLAFIFAARNSRHAAPFIAHDDARFSQKSSPLEKGWTRGPDSQVRLRPPSPLEKDWMRGPDSQVRLRPLYSYSVIPGGVHSAQELKYAIAHDAVVAEHYADFDIAKARIVRLQRTRTAYVSYRLGDRIYWTKKRLRRRESSLTASTKRGLVAGTRLQRRHRSPCPCRNLRRKPWNRRRPSSVSRAVIRGSNCRRFLRARSFRHRKRRLRTRQDGAILPSFFRSWAGIRLCHGGSIRRHRQSIHRPSQRRNQAHSRCS